jgi:hypothetical protein
MKGYIELYNLSSKVNDDSNNLIALLAIEGIAMNR